MPLFCRWRKLSTLPQKRARDALAGVYELANAKKEIIYIGQSATDVPNRIRQHLQKSDCIKDQVVFWRYEYSRVPQAEEAKQIDRFINKFNCLPLCNTATPKTRNALKRYAERSR